MDDEERVVLLGVVQEKQGVDGASPYVCKAGGRPAWYGNEEPPEVRSLVCSKCKHSLFFVAQVYAPVDSDRSLYVFGCNSPECTETPGSWRVLRHQVESTSEPHPATSAETKHAAPPPAPAPTSGWAAGDDDSDWSDDDDDKGADSGASFGLDLESLLEQRDNALKSSAPPAPVAAPVTAVIRQTESKPSTVKDAQDSTATAKLNAFPALPIEVINEPYEDYIRENDYSHENELLQAYIKSEEEEKSVDVSDLRRILSSTKKSNGDSVAAVGGGGSGESYERTPAQMKHFQRFQKRINRCPLQVLRYDYGGEPLWPTPVQKNKIKPPRCVCGEERAFEMQLTPTINYFLKVDDFAHMKLQVPQAATAGAATATAVGGGMDWASVVVYSCSKSCSQSREEFVYVLPAQT